MRGALLVSSLLSLIGLSACNTPFAGKSDSAAPGVSVTRCDGSAVGQAMRSEAPVPVPTSLYVSADVGDHPGSGKQGLVALSAVDGAERWCVRFALTQIYTCPSDGHCPAPPTAIVGMPLVVADVVYSCVSGGAAGITYALDTGDGSLRWSRDTGCRIVSIPFGDNAQPMLVDGVLYSGAYGLSPEDGSVRWRLPSSVTQETIGAVASGMVYVFGEENVSAIRRADDAVMWTFKLDAPIGNRPAPFGDHLYVGDVGGNSPPAVVRGLPDTYALDIQTGRVVWRAPTGVVAGSIAIEANGLVYIGAENMLNALDAATGAFRWRVTLPYDVYVASSPILAHGLIYFVGDGAYAVDALTGGIRWHNPLGWDPSTSFGGPTLGNGVLYLVGTNGEGHSVLYALDPASGGVSWRRSDVNALTPPAM
jgi:outer membrane protein assembly factor BamB